MQELNTIIKNKPNTKIFIGTEKSKTDKQHITLQDVASLLLGTRNILFAFIQEQREFNKYVLEQFKKHGWVK